MIRTGGVAWLLAGSMMCALLGALDAKAQAALQRYAVPGHGSLQLNVPKEWRTVNKPLDDPASVLLRFRPASGEAFYVQVTTVWLDPAKRPSKTPEQIKTDVRRSAEKPLQSAVEKDALIEELRGAKVIGYHYSLTDRAPGPGEYKYLTQGIFVSGELLTIFTILSHDPAFPEKARILQMFAGAAHAL